MNKQINIIKKNGTQLFFFHTPDNSGFVYHKTSGELVLQYGEKIIKVQEKKNLNFDEVFYELYQYKYLPWDPCAPNWFE